MNTSALGELGLVAKKQGNAALAGSLWERAVQINPRDPTAPRPPPQKLPPIKD